MPYVRRRCVCGDWDCFETVWVDDMYLYKSSLSRRKSRFQLDIWEWSDGSKEPIKGMTKMKLRQAIGYIKSGYHCFGQKHKVISLEKELARRKKA